MKVDVIVLTYGEPAQPDFMIQWEYSNRILYKLTRLVAPIPKVAVPLVGAYRGWKRQRQWRQENFRSPMEEITQRQADIIRENLHQRQDGHQWTVHVAYEFRDPSLHETLEKIEKEGTDVLIFALMYVPISDFTSGISERDWKAYTQSRTTTLPEPRAVVLRPYLKPSPESWRMF